MTLTSTETLALEIQQGSVLEFDLELTEDDGSAYDLTSATARMQVRRTYNSDTALLDITDSDDITLGGTTGVLTVSVGATDTAALTPGRAVYDIEVLPGDVEDDAIRVLSGNAIISPEVTR